MGGKTGDDSGGFQHIKNGRGGERSNIINHDSWIRPCHPQSIGGDGHKHRENGRQ